MEKKQRVIFYVDGFNLYFGLKSKKWKRYYWLDVVKFFRSFLKTHQDLIEVSYFTAIPTDRGKHNRQDLFLSANKLNPKFILHLGKFLTKEIPYKETTISTYEEKQTDVNIAVKMIRDVVLNRCDISILVSADSDLIPPFDFIKEYKPTHKVFVYFPPNRFSYDLKMRADNILHLQNHQQKFDISLLSEEIKLPNGYIIKRPDKWK